MNLDSVITRIRQACPSFALRVAGAAEFSALPANAKVALPAAFVIPMDDQAGDQESGNRYRQAITDRIAVVVVLVLAALFMRFKGGSKGGSGGGPGGPGGRLRRLTQNPRRPARRG